jgi:hypothetical protein
MSKIEVNEIDAQSGTTITVGSACKSVAVPGNVVKTNAVQASDAGNIISQSGTTITIGASGDTVSLASGASQSGFGRSGTVNWQTTPKTGDFTAVNGEGYFVNTTSGAITMTMPSGSAGAIVSIQDYNKTFDSNNFTVTPASGQKINGGTADGSLVIATEGQGLTFVYVDSTVGWKTVHENEFTAGGSSFIEATGGTVSCSGDDRIHTFTGPGTFTVSATAACAANNVVSYLVVAGGGGSGGNRYHIQGGGGGGAGGFREAKSPATPYTASPLDGYPSSPNRVTVTATAFPITVGAGGAAGGTGGGSVPEGANATSGANSVFSTITAAGGGFGGNPRTQGPAQPEGEPGGSGGGGGGGSPGPKPGGTGNTPPTSPAQGTNGGGGSTGNQTLGGSGGGATGAGSTSPGCSPPPSTPSRGTGATTSITGSPVAYAAGGSYSSYNPSGADPSCAGATNKGNGADARNAGPGPTTPSTPNDNYAGRAGGSGVVIIRYKRQ